MERLSKRARARRRGGWERVRSELRALWQLAAPLALIQAGNQLMGVVDTALLGRVGAVPLGAVGLGNALFFAVAIVGMGIMMGLDPMISQAMGAGDERRARHLLWQSGWLAGALAAALLFLLVPLALLLERFGITPEVAPITRAYLLIRAASLLPLLLFVGLRGYLQGAGRTRPLLAAVAAANLLNFALSWLLVFGAEGLPDALAALPLLRAVPPMGAAGAAIATCAATLAMVLTPLAMLRASREGALERGEHLRAPSRAELGQALRIGLPIGLQMGAEVGLFSLVALCAGQLGEEALAAHQLAITLAGFSFAISVGIGAAGSVRVGRAIGAREPRTARWAGLVALSSGALFMAFAALLLLSMPGLLARALTDQPRIVSAALPLIAIAALFQLSDGVQAVGAGILRGAGDTRASFLINLAGHYLLGLPVALVLCFGMELGVRGLWWGLCAGLTAVALALSLRFLAISARGLRPLARQRPESG